MRKDIQINVNSETNQVLRNNETLGISTENLQGKIIFKPEPFVDGACRMHIENKGSVLMDKEEDCYTLDIKSSLLITPGIDICFKITEAENEDGIPIFCTQKMYFKVLDTIESSSEIPEDYPSWEQILDSKIAELNELEQSIEAGEEERNRKVDEAVENIEDMTEAYNQNAVEKTNEFNTNATNKTTAFDNHVSSKEDEFDNDTDTIVSTKKVELDDYETAKENELDTHANSLKNDLDDYESAKETELNNYTSTKKTELDTYTNTKKTELDTHEENLESALDSEASDLISAFNTNATEKTNNFNTNATNKTTDFNDNATQKTTDFNDNATEKTTEYDTNATEKVDEYNANAEDKIAEYDAHVAELQTEIDELKETVDSELETAVVEGTSIDVSDSAKADGSICVGGNTEQATSILPEGYTQVEYIESSGTQDIDTGINVIDIFNTCKIVEVAQYTSLDRQQFGFLYFKSETSNENCFFAPIAIYNNYFFAQMAPRTGQSLTVADTNKHKFITDNLNQKAYIDEDSYSITATNNSDILSGNLHLFNRNGATVQTYCKKKLYKMTIYNNDIVIADFIPCKNQNNEVGLYDLVSNTFFGNSGTGSFVAGNEVTIPNPPYPQEIKKVTGDNKIKCTRKNLLPSTVFEFCTITSSGEKIIGNSRICSDFIKVKKLQDYTLSSINQFGFIGVAFYDSNKKYIDRTIGNNIKSIKVSIPAQCSYVKVFGEYGSGTEQSIIAFKKHKVQLELGTATDYEEYKGKEFELNLWTENKFDKNGNIKNNYYLDANGGEVENTGAWFTEYYIEVKPNTLYLIKGGQNFKRICYYDKNKEFISRDNSEIDRLKCITPTNCAYVRLSNNGEYDSLEFKECIELCKIGDYKDVLFKNEKTSKYYNASLMENAWYKYRAIAKYYFSMNKILAISSKNFYINLDEAAIHNKAYMTNYRYSSKTSGYDNLEEGCFGIENNTKGTIHIKDSNYTDRSAFTQALVDKNEYLLYVLKTPTYEQITNETLIAQLEALHKFRTEQGVIHIWTEAEELEPNLEFTYKRSNNLRLQALEQAVVALGGV